MIMKKTILTLLLVMVSCMATQAQMVGATNRSRGVTVKERPTYKPTGGAIHMELGLPTTLGYGHWLNSNLMVGGGIGFNMSEHMKRDEHIPLFAQVRFSTPKYAFGVFVDLKVGIDLKQLINEDDWFDSGFHEYPQAHLMAGVSFGNFSLGGGIMLAYDEQWKDVLGIGFQSGVEGGLFVRPIVSLSYDLYISTLKNLLL
jgi:hypothetical protein